MKGIAWFVSICADNGLKLSGEQIALFENYRELLLSWNTRVNLISRKDENNFYLHHALNCISFLFTKELKSDGKVLDLGTGGGLPGIPLKILYPNLDFVLVDSIAKKTLALSDIVRQMQLRNVVVLTGRAEEIGKHREFKGKFDYVITRAAGKLHEVIKWSRVFLKEFELPGSSVIPVGTLIVLKGGTINEELRAARNLKFVESIKVEDITFNGMDDLANKEKKIILVKYFDLGRKI